MVSNRIIQYYQTLVQLHCFSSKGSRVPISLMRRHTQYYTRSEYNTQLAKMSCAEIFISQQECMFILIIYLLFFTMQAIIIVLFFVLDGNTRAKVAANRLHSAGIPALLLVVPIFATQTCRLTALLTCDGQPSRADGSILKPVYCV